MELLAAQSHRLGLKFKGWGGGGGAGGAVRMDIAGVDIRSFGS